MRNVGRGNNNLQELNYYQILQMDVYQNSSNWRKDHTAVKAIFFFCMLAMTKIWWFSCISLNSSSTYKSMTHGFQNITTLINDKNEQDFFHCNCMKGVD